jgi:hypothetical protein
MKSDNILSNFFETWSPDSDVVPFHLIISNKDEQALKIFL